MFRLRSLWGRSRRLCHSQAVSCDRVLDQLKACSAEDQVLDVVGQNEAKLSVSHVSVAVGLLWQFQINRPQALRTFDLIHSHPQFLTLRVLAKNNISLMDEESLVNMLYHMIRLRVEHHDTLVQQLVTEAWNRLEGYMRKLKRIYCYCTWSFIKLQWQSDQKS